ncbi:sugar (and other) transporter family protein [Burkholderia cepacia]|uniref:Sugar (And other) transporter family protein n=2 Tax=Burkholderia cepacia TaxID=292 RepID=A0AA88Z6Z0_BURCE|nr:sugar (and other) transporter family protein [Burkholderia cepacia]
MPASLLTPIARDLAISEGQAGLSIVVSGAFAVTTSLLGNPLLARLDRRAIVLLYTAALTISSLIVAAAPNFMMFLLGRALIGMAIGGFWSLSTAIVARLARQDDVSKAIALLQVGTAAALVIAAPLGSFLESRMGWRETFFVTVPIGLLAFVWQLIVLPRMPSTETPSVASTFRLLRRRNFAAGMVAITLSFAGQNSLSIYLRPFLEAITGFHAEAVSLVLLGLGLGGFAGLSLIGVVLRRYLTPVLVGLPVALSTLALLLLVLGRVQPIAVLLLLLWGLCSTPLIVAWNTWMAGVIPDDLEAGGGLQVALIQCAIAGGAFAGGVLLDSVGWWSAFLLAAVLLLGSTLSAAVAVAVSHRTHINQVRLGESHV